MLRRFKRALVALVVFLCLSLLGIGLVTNRSRLQMYAPRALLAAIGYEPCAPRNNIVFLKTHKCASSTVMNILLRYGTEHGLNFVLPKSDSTHYIGHPEEVHALMPADSLYVTIVRRPDSLFESLYSYCDMGKTFKRNLTMFSRDRKLTGSLSRHRVERKIIGFNQMSFDLGYKGRFDSEQAVAKFVKKIASSFHLVMLADRFDESLVLLKHLLCWNTTDMAALKINSRSTCRRRPRNSCCDSTPPTWQLYNYFAKVFDEKVKAFGVDRMAAEVEELRAKQREYYDRCVKAEVPIQKLYPRYKRKNVVAFKSKDNSTLCRHLTLDELAFHEEVKKMQQARVRRYLAHQKRARSSSSSFKHVTKGVAARTSTSQPKAPTKGDFSEDVVF
ncbi:hypothetical protein MTO96_026464 [Rhipicephalus appendiculatus]